jgi:hypothetical protein
MTKPACSFSQARDALVKALTDYQTATRDMSLALERVSAKTGAVYESLSTVIHTSGAMIARRG